MMKKVLFVAFFLLMVATSPSYAEDNADAYSFKETMLLEIDIDRCSLDIYKLPDDGEKILVRELSVATVKKGVKEYPLGAGKITRVDIDPYWYPTDNSVDYMNKELISRGKRPLFKKGEEISPRDPRNAMGAFKMHLSHNVPGKGVVYRIHGTNQPSSIGKRASSGCIRVSNADGLPLAKNIKQRLKNGEVVKVIITESGL